MPINNYALREVADLTFIDLSTNKPFLFMDYALTSTNEHAMETTYATGGQGNPRRASFDGNKTSSLKVSTQVFDWRFINLLSGAQVSTGATNVFKREVLTATEATGVKVTLSETPVADTVTIFPIEEDAVAGQEETISLAGDVATITAGVAGNEYVAYYQFQSEATAEKIEFKSNVFPKTCKIIGDTLIKNKDDINEPFQMVAYKAKPNGSFTLTQSSSGDPSTLEITFELLSNENNQMIDYIRY